MEGNFQKLKRGRPKNGEQAMSDEDRKKHLRIYNRTYYQTVEKFKDKAITCQGCGKQVNKGHYEKHLASMYHIKHLKYSYSDNDSEVHTEDIEIVNSENSE